MSAFPVLTADRGNSTLDLCVWLDAATPARRERVAVDDDGAIEAVLAESLPAGSAAQMCVAASVVPGGLELLERVLDLHRIPLRRAGQDIACPLEVHYDDPSTLGVDRWVGAVAARSMLDRATHGVTVDCGTALTVNLVSAEGDFLGGAIAPGPMTWVRALAQAAPALPRGNLDTEVVLPARSTPGAVDSGIQHGFRAAVRGLLTACLNGAGIDFADARLFVTGGDAQVILRGGFQARATDPVFLGMRHVPDLVHRGLLELAMSESA